MRLINCLGLHYLKLNLKLIFFRLFLGNWLYLPASASEAIAPRRSTNRVLLLLLLHGTPAGHNDCIPFGP